MNQPFLTSNRALVQRSLLDLASLVAALVLVCVLTHFNLDLKALAVLICSRNVPVNSAYMLKHGSPT